MARKSLVKDIRDIFENDSNKGPTSKYCDEKVQCAKDKQYDDSRKNRKIQTSKSIDPSFKYTRKEQYSSSNHKSNGGSLKETINRFNAESTKSRNSASVVKIKETHNSSTLSRCSSKHDTVPTVKNNQSSTKNKIGKLSLNNFERISNDFQAPKNNIEKHSGSLKKEIETPSTNNLPKRVNVENTDELKNKINRNRKVPVIATKPKYINKIKPHPNMPLTAKNDLLEKIKIFNNLANNETKKAAQPESDENSQTTNAINQNLKLKSDKKPAPPPKIISSDENPYDIVQNPNMEAKKSLRHVQKISPKDKYKTPKVLPKRNSKEELYDVVQNPNTNIKDFRSVLKSNSEKNLYDVVENSNRSRNNNNAKLIQGKSLEVLEGEGYTVVQPSDTANEENLSYGNIESDNSSEDELATEYDVIQNLNVTKITVERRYKIPDNNKEDSTFNVKRETYYDHNLNPRIERISRHKQKNQESSTSNNAHVKKSLMIIQELLQTELVYFKGLLRVYEDYIVYFKESPRVCTPNIWKVFGNFEEIYKRQIEFYGELTECNNDVNAIAETFLKNELLFNLYENYIVNRHTSVKYSMGECFHVIQARDKELGNKLNLDSHLLTPFQRLLRYRLLLKNLKETLENENSPSSKLDDAVNYLDNFIEGTNIHAKVIQGIQNAPIDLSGRGKILLIDECYVRNNGKKYKSTVILFEDIIIFTRKAESETYIYKNSINLSDLYIRSIAEDVTSFQLQNFPEFRLKHDNKYVFDVEVSDSKVKQEWVKKMESLLWNQFAAHKRS